MSTGLLLENGASLEEASSVLLVGGVSLVVGVGLLSLWEDGSTGAGWSRTGMFSTGSSSTGEAESSALIVGEVGPGWEVLSTEVGSVEGSAGAGGTSSWTVE